MNKGRVLEQVRAAGVIPVVRAASADEALLVAGALIAGGLTVLEITLTVPDAARVISALARQPQLTVGAGSVLGAEAVRASLAAGARFIVSPALDLEVVAAARASDTAVLAGALTPTEVVRAWNAGADLVKVFPASAVGGPSYLRALKGPLPHVELVPTGGVTFESIPDYFGAGAAAVGAGSELADVAAIRRGDTASVSARARAWLDAVRAARATASPT